MSNDRTSPAYPWIPVSSQLSLLVSKITPESLSSKRHIHFDGHTFLVMAEDTFESGSYPSALRPRPRPPVLFEDHIPRGSARFFGPGLEDDLRFPMMHYSLIYELNIKNKWTTSWIE